MISVWHMSLTIFRRNFWISAGPLVAASIMSLAVLVFVSIFILNNLSERLIRQQAEREAIAWAGYIGSSIDRIDEIARGSEPTPTELKYLLKVRKFGNIFSFKIFDSDGILHLVSDELTSQINQDANLGKHNPTAARVITSGQPFAEVKDGTNKANRPDIYVEAYVPIFRDGKIAAISEVYIDQTESSNLIRTDFTIFGLIIFGLTLVVLLVPLWGLRLLTEELQKRNHELNIERARAVDAESAKSKFLAHMSHELRTPLNAIQGLSEMMVRGDLGSLNHPKYLEYSKDINFSAAHLLKLVNDILDLSKIDAGKFELKEDEFDINQMIIDTLRIARAWSSASNKELLTDDDPPPLIIRADERAIKQILLNLLSNATKYTPEGGTVHISTGLDPNGNGIIRIADTGYGIPEKDLNKIIEPFNQLHRPAGLQQEGTGLGLSLVKSMVDMHGGTLDIQSREGQGTTVIVTLPAERMLVAEYQAQDVNGHP